jgi:hypothetical protein
VSDSHARSHQFLISLTKPETIGKAELVLPAFAGSQRETGEVLVEGIGTMELSAAERGGLRRMDVKESSAQLRGLAKNPVHAAFRYQKRASEVPGVAMEWVRFPDAPVTAAVAQRAVVTTLVTSEGRSLTEVKLRVRNREQAFVKVALPKAAQILSAEVAGERVKPVTAADGDRVPLLRPGFRPSGEYEVSFVFLHEGTPFARKGGSELALPKMDMPVGLVTWEVFLPKQYRVAEFGGDAIPERLLPVMVAEELYLGDKDVVLRGGVTELDSLGAGQIGGYVVDASGAVVPRATVVATLPGGGTLRTVADNSGRWLIAGVPSGRVRVRVESAGFKAEVRDLEYDASRAERVSVRLNVGAANESVQVNSGDQKKQSAQMEREARQNAAAADVAASSNVTALQNRVVGVLPIAVNVPRAGNSYRFVRPLVVDEETRVTFQYRQGK